MYSLRWHLVGTFHHISEESGNLHTSPTILILKELDFQKAL